MSFPKDTNIEIHEIIKVNTKGIKNLKGIRICDKYVIDKILG